VAKLANYFVLHDISARFFEATTNESGFYSRQYPRQGSVCVLSLKRTLAVSDFIRKFAKYNYYGITQNKILS